VNHKVIELNEENFTEEVLEAHRPVVVQFWVGWSELCRAMAPVVELAAEDRAIPVKLARVNVEQNGQLAERYGVQALPTVLIFKQGGLREQIIGRTTELELREKLESLK